MKKYIFTLFILLNVISISCSKNGGAKVPETVLIKGGHFKMGDSSDDRSDNYPAHYIYIKNFYIGKYEVTYKQFSYFLEENPNWKKSNLKNLIKKKLVDVDYLNDWKKGKYPKKLANHPVTYVSWFSAVAYCAWLSKITGKKIRLPGEAEWEYAAGNGNKHEPFPIFPIDKKQLTFAENPGPFQTTRPVGSHKPNKLGVYDLGGNVWEFTMSKYMRYPYRALAVESMKHKKHDTRIVIRGGSFNSYFFYTSTIFRNFKYANQTSEEVGFRIAYTAEQN